MVKKFAIILGLFCFACGIRAAQVNEERTVTVGGKARKYVLYVPTKTTDSPALVFSLHGAAGHDTDRSPFRTSVADSEGCIVVYPQGENQYFPIFGGSTPGWNATGEANEDLDFFKAVIEAVAKEYPIDRQRIYCCGFSNGGMMTYSNSTTAADIFAAFASISGFQLNEFHHRPTGARPVPFLHIHGKADDFVKYSCMPVIRDNMVARNGCNPVPQVQTSSGRYTRSTYGAGEGSFPYVYYEIDGMGHNDYTDKTPDGNSALTMWKFMSQYKLDDECDKTLKWRLNIDTEGWKPEEHSWTVNKARILFAYGTPKKSGNADNNVYPSLQFEKGNYFLTFESTGEAGNKMYVKVETLDGKSTLFCKSGVVGEKVVMPFSVDK
ncbi:MAG: prolyl oligopeptidase family serine peptidase, partial [Bacteroidaceae bacterium]|nr:prolyl oligopeptidase family serine peptidase [Bacteroidaceae bacterium]